MDSPKVEITLDVDYKGHAEMKRFERDFARANREAKGLRSTMAGTSRSFDTFLSGQIKLRKHFDKFDAMVKAMGAVGLKMLKFSLKAATLEMAAMGVAMVALHGAFVAGNAIVKVFRASLGPLAAGMAGVTAAIAVASAAIREQQAAMYAYKTKTMPQFGSGLNQTRQVMRELMTDTDLAAAGAEGLNRAFAAVSKTSTFSTKSRLMLKDLMDFASAGQPIEEGMEKAGQLIAALQDARASWSETKLAAEGLFPDPKAMKKAFEKLGINSKKELQAALKSGSLGEVLGVTGQFDAVSGTLINRFKAYFNTIRQQFADIGQPLLEPVKQAAFEVFKIIQRGLVKIGGTTKRFGMTTLLESIVSAVDKLVNWSTNLINNELKSVEGMFDRMASWWKEFVYGWNSMLDRLRPFIDGARVIEAMFGAVWKHVKNIVSSSFGQFNEWLVKNRDTVVEFGDRIGELVAAIMRFQGEMKKLLMDMMPFINDVVNGLSSMVDMLTGFIKGLRTLTGGGAVGALATFMGIRAGLSAMKGTKGGFVPKMNTATINAQQAVINAPSVVSGGGGLGTTGAAAGLSSRSGSPIIAAAGSSSRSGMAGLGSRGGIILPGGGGGGTGPIIIPGAGGGGTGGPLILPAGYTPTPTGPTTTAPVVTPTPAAATRNSRFSSAFGKFRDFEKKYFQNVGMTDEDRYMKKAYVGTGQYDIASQKEIMKNRSGMRAAWARRSMANRIGRNESSFGRGMTRFQGSQSARMGTGLLLGAASQFAPAEAQGAMALGGSIAMFNPLAGIGVAGLGTAMKAKTATGGAMSGLAGGAAAGALVGTIIPGIGTAAGAIIGGLLGAVSGGIMGTLNKKKEEVKRSKAAATAAAQSIVNSSFSFTLDAVRSQTGVGRSATRDTFGAAMKYQENLLGVLSGVPLNRKNFAGFMPDVLNRGATGGQVGLALESATGKRMPKALRNIIGGGTIGMDIVGNLLYGTASKLGMKSLLDNRVLNPFGYGTNNKKDVDRQKQEATLTQIFRNQSRYGVTISDTEYEDMLKKPGEALRKLQEETMTTQKAMEPLQKNYNKRLDELNKITGKSDQEIMQLAKTMNVNLMDSTKSFSEVLSELGLTVTKTADQMKAATTNVVTNSLSAFDTALKKMEAPRIVNELAQSFRNTYDAQGGKLTDEQRVKFVRDVMEQNIMMYGEGGTALAQTIKSFGPGGTAFKGGPLKGMKGVDFNDPLIQGVFAQARTELGGVYGEQINSMLLKGGKSIDVAEFTRRVEKMTPEQLANLNKVAEQGLGSGAASMRMIESYGSREQALLAAIGLGDMTLSTVTKDKTDLENLPKEIGDKTVELIDQMKIFFQETDKAVPEWYKTAPSWWEKDTSTPRGGSIGDTTSSRLSQTLGRHSAMDGMLTGKRTVTSSYRTFGLGSVNSDHVTGRAYDLVGQNLGQYQSLVKAGGGFAEFHGVNGARHLHVVPGPGPFGDSMVPRMSSMAKPAPVSTSSRSGANYNFYITGTANASANEIADQVIVKLKNIERSNRERS